MFLGQRRRGDWPISDLLWICGGSHELVAISNIHVILDYKSRFLFVFHTALALIVSLNCSKWQNWSNDELFWSFVMEMKVIFHLRYFCYRFLHLHTVWKRRKIEKESPLGEKNKFCVEGRKKRRQNFFRLNPSHLPNHLPHLLKGPNRYTHFGHSLRTYSQRRDNAGWNEAVWDFRPHIGC